MAANEATVDISRIKKKRMGGKGRIIDLVALEEVRKLLGDEPRRKDLLIEHLHKIQDHYHYISSKHLVALAHEMNISTTEVYEVATFYHHFDAIKDDELPPPPLTVRVCESVSCDMAGSDEIIMSLQSSLGADAVRIQPVPCVGRCEKAPVAVVGQNPIDQATPQSIMDAVNNNVTKSAITNYLSYGDYCKQGGYKVLEECYEGIRDKETVRKTMEDSGLRGLGGAGFPAGLKWKIVSGFEGPRLMAVNIDEGEPGTFKDRYYLEIDPHRFFEGMLIAAWAVGIDEIYIYLRDEYAGIRKILTQELERLQSNPPFSHPLPELHLRRGAGAYICGEESAMIESIEGKRGMPRLRPPFVAEVGLFGRPTLEHNMETLYWVREILEKGPDWFTSHGRNGRKGLRSFSVSGRVKKPGVHLAPAGITIKELIDEFCGGMLDGHEFYGYFPGGASGGILPATMGDIPMDFDTLNDYGCFIGSAAVMVFSDQDSAKELALNAMKFFEDESCGQCTPCRVGTAKAVDLMKEEDWDTDLLEELANVMADASICGLGQAAPNPLRCAVKYFPEEFKN